MTKKDKHYTICLNMIVKDEEHIIQETLENICSNIMLDYWVISDTGSSDNTKQIIVDFFAKKQIKGEIYDDQWVDFSHNRNKALEYAFGKTDYLLVFDADDRIEGNLKIPKLGLDSYLLTFGPQVMYQRVLLVNNRKKWKFIGVLHEVIQPDGVNYSLGQIQGNYHIISGRSGNRNKNPNKYQDDAIILAKAFEKEQLTGNKDMIGRYAYYCAQSYKDAQQYDLSIEWYTKLLDLDYNNIQEKYIASITIGDIYQKQQQYESAVIYWKRAAFYDPKRIESIVQLMIYYNNTKDFLITQALYCKYKDYKTFNTSNTLLKNSLCYQGIIEYQYIVASLMMNQKEECQPVCKILLLDKNTTSEIKNNILHLIQKMPELMINEHNTHILKMIKQFNQENPQP